MPEPVNIDLTARVAAEERARRADLATGERSIDILVIDDQPDHEAGWFARHLPGHRRLSLESVSELERFLAGKRLPNLPQPPYRPELAILDPEPGRGPARRPSSTAHLAAQPRHARPAGDPEH
jgi:hypothetical protein